jgi:ribosome-associated heat shock protein Hsp15
MSDAVVRLDKWLQVARVFKTRSQATRACNLSRVEVNGETAKAHRRLALEDRVEVEIGDWTRILVVKELRDKTLPKAEAPRLYEDLSPPRPQLDPLERLMRRRPVERERGAGRPSKKERRQLERLRES